jgi:hypothetical protein
MAFHIANADADSNAKVIYLSHQNANDPNDNATAAAAVVSSRKLTPCRTERSGSRFSQADSSAIARRT